MTNSRFKYAATLLGALAVLAVAPATAHAEDNEPTGDGYACHYSDADGYDIPIGEGEGVFVDGKIVSCKDGEIVVTTAPMRGGGQRPPVLDTPAQRPPVFTPARPPVFSPNLPVLVVTP